MSREILFKNGIFHSGITQEDTFSCMTVKNGVITGTYSTEKECPEKSGLFRKTIDLNGRHVYPCLIDAHVHMLLTIAVMAMGFSICEITESGVQPKNLAGIEKRLREYAGRQKKGAVVACNNYILTAIEERRMPTKEELDEWGGGRPVIIYNIDGHSTALSTEMLKLVGIDPASSNGVLQGEENERTQGRITDVIGSLMTPSMLAKGIANFQNACAAYGINIVGALEGNGDSPKDLTTALIAAMARHFDAGVRLYLQYTDLKRVKKYRKWMKHPRVGGCGDWEMDGASGSHSAAFTIPYKDTMETAPCYYEQKTVNRLVRNADRKGYQIASHAIGDAAITRLLTALEKLETNQFHRIEHCEFLSDESFELLKKGKYALMMQPGYAWIDKRYLHTYEQFLPDEIIRRMKFRSLYEAGICVCGSSDSPVQDLDPYLQMLGMTCFYHEEESVTPYEAFQCYTSHAARAIQEETEYGTLETGKKADFFTATSNFFTCKPEEIISFRPEDTWYSGKKYKRKTGSLPELLGMLLTPPKKI